MSIGEALAEARGQAGLTVTEVSRRTRIREAIIKGIECDNYSACGGDFYARGNIRSIAKVVGADSEPLIREYDAVHRAPGPLSAVSLDELVTRSQTSGTRGRTSGTRGQAPGTRARTSGTPVQASGKPVQESGQHRLNWTAVLGLALVVALGFAGYNLISRSLHVASTPPAVTNHGGTDGHAGGSGAPPAQKTGQGAASLVHPARALIAPVPTVRAYVAAINGHNYARAWHLGGKNTGGSYSQFVGGFSDTARDTLTIVSVSSDVVTARLTAHETDGTVTIYQGTYTVDNGVIVGFDVLQVG